MPSRESLRNGGVRRLLLEVGVEEERVLRRAPRVLFDPSAPYQVTNTTESTHRVAHAPERDRLALGLCEARVENLRVVGRGGLRDVELYEDMSVTLP